ncbi:MAG: XTP/dITP diphosphatase [Candidatus Omnitrophica bacterium]|nr:XTP/dITP diphosphatase [Candidatus Omnitrophota bacterium]MBU4478883.1 XTP/dITP diphosphatase [Candidatus Omnitrophota bacterium]MCG2702963.1 XTP/dITP diphosphatase [Candidatus Omnitrophota bacterium]
MEVVVSTRNKNKFKEIVSILKDAKIKAVSLDAFSSIPEVKEDGKTFADNAAKKALKIAGITKRLTVADDSGLEVAALGGAPGVYSARFSGKAATYESNNEKLLRMLNGVAMKKRRARFVCCVAIADARGIVDIVEADYRGYIAQERKGKNGFGYDPVFFCPRLKKTFAQLTPGMKNKLSHRARAFLKAKKSILKYIRLKRGCP